MSHQDAYCQAWMEYKDCRDPVRKKELEQAMDEAQNNFTWDEFQAFKITLPGFVEFWSNLLKDAERRVDERFSNTRGESETKLL